MTRAALSMTSISVGTQPSRSATAPWPEITPPVGWTKGGKDAVGPSHRDQLAIRVQGDGGPEFGLELGGVRRVLGFLQAPDLEEAELRPRVDQTRPDVEPFGVDDLGFFGDAQARIPDRGDLAARHDDRPALDVGAGDRVEVGLGDGIVPPWATARSSALALAAARLAAGMAVWSPGRGSALPDLFLRWKWTSPSTRAISQRANPSNGWAVNRAMSASLPTSIDPIRLSRPSSRAGLIVIMARAVASGTPPYLTILAASR